jgi:uncharacterized protein (TIGR02300 family)
MRKASQKTTPVSLGTKRACPGCGTKFYDFNKEEIICPKCSSKVEPNSAAPARPVEAKKPAKLADPEDADDVVPGNGPAGDSEEAFESVEDLDEDDDVIDVKVENDDDQEDY